MAMRKTPTCGGCGADGHTSTSPLCPIKAKRLAEENEKLVALVKASPLEVDWTSIAAEMDMKSEAVCETRFASALTPAERVKINVEKLGLDPLRAVLIGLTAVCDKCKKGTMVGLINWKGTKICLTCHHKHKEEIDMAWKQIDLFLRMSGMTECRICGVERAEQLGFHFDHLNMFVKEDSVCNLVRSGAEISVIQDEIKKCQLLCRSCHAGITQVERLLGFSYIKLLMTRTEKGTLKEGVELDVEDYTALYRRTMQDIVYPMMRQIIKEGEIYAIPPPGTSPPTQES